MHITPMFIVEGNPNPQATFKLSSLQKEKKRGGKKSVEVWMKSGKEHEELYKS